MKTLKIALILTILMASYNAASTVCTGTFYAVEGPRNAPTGFSLWTFAKDGTVVSSSSNEPAVPFSPSQGNWEIESRRFIKSTTFDFSGPPSPAYPNVARVEAIFNFQRNCQATVAGASKFSVFTCPVAQGPLCIPGTVVVEDVPIELTKVND